ncbi:MAG: glutathione peroxidase [Verrucomicrobiota bacterium]
MTLPALLLRLLPALAAGPLLLASAPSIHEVEVTRLMGGEATLAEHAGEVMLIVNVASRCGYTSQYAPLEEVYQKYQDDGLVVLGFPCNQFAGQEPGSSEDIAEFCQVNYGVTFPLHEKIEVNGPERHPLYTVLAGPESPFAGDIGWNFTKFLVGRDGEILARFESAVKPDAPEVIAAIERALAAPSAG